MTRLAEAAARRDRLITLAHARMLAAERQARADHPGSSEADYRALEAAIEGAVLKCRLEVAAARDEFARFASSPWRRAWRRLRDWLTAPAKPKPPLRASEGRGSDGPA